MSSLLQIGRDWLRPFKRRLEERRFQTGSRLRLVARYQFPSLLNARELLGVGVEIGVYEGWFSNYLLTYWRGRRLISIDPWRALGDEYQDACNREQPIMDQFYHRAQQLLRNHGERSEIWRMTSREAACRLGDEALDFVYIDAQHHFEAVREDLELWHPKVRSGGLLAGHDYMDGDFAFGRFGVKSAVDQFAQKHHVRIELTRENNSPSWFFFKS